MKKIILYVRARLVRAKESRVMPGTDKQQADVL